MGEPTRPALDSDSAATRSVGFLGIVARAVPAVVLPPHATRMLLARMIIARRLTACEPARAEAEPLRRAHRRRRACREQSHPSRESPVERLPSEIARPAGPRAGRVARRAPSRT